MRKGKMAAGLLALYALGVAAPGSADENAEAGGFKRVRGSAIQRLISGRDFSDGVHWRYSFQPGGALTEYAMSRRQDLRWQTKDDALCWQSARCEDCFEVWTSSTTLRLQPVALGALFEGSLSRLVP